MLRPVETPITQGVKRVGDLPDRSVEPGKHFLYDLEVEGNEDFLFPGFSQEKAKPERFKENAVAELAVVTFEEFVKCPEPVGELRAAFPVILSDHRAVIDEAPD